MTWGAESTLENGCTSSSGQETGCTDTLETYAYNKRLQPVTIELGTTATPAADYCLVYNDYASLGSPGSCAAPSQGAGDNGNVMGVFDQDNANPSLSHTETYSYDSLNRLTNAAATGNSTYNLTFNYDPYGNMTCAMNQNTQGFCPQYSFNSENNRITNTGYTYDADGDLTSDGSNNYYYDGEKKMVYVDGAHSFETSMGAYSQLTNVVENNAETVYMYDPAQRWIGDADNGWVVAGVIRLNGRILAEYPWGGSSTLFLHPDLLHSTAMDTRVAHTSRSLRCVRFTRAGPFSGEMRH